MPVPPPLLQTSYIIDPCDGTDVVPAVTRPTDVEAVGDELVDVLPVPHDNRVLAGVDQDVQRVLWIILGQPCGLFERISHIFEPKLTKNSSTC